MSIMMGRDHALSGALAGLGATSLISALSVHPLTLPAQLAGTLIVTGAVMLPDWDHPQATVAHAFGPLSRAIAHGLNGLSEMVFDITKSRYDKPRSDGHRLLTHTLIWAAALAGTVLLLGHFWPLWTVLGTTYLCASLALAGLAGSWVKRNGWLVTAAAAAALTAACWRLAPQLDPPLLAGLVALGCWVHCLGDSCTLAGCPWLALLVTIKGQRWYPIGTPRWLRFRTGTEEFDGEDWLRWAMYVALGVVACNAALFAVGLGGVIGTWTRVTGG